MEKIYNILLHEGTDQHAFLEEVTDEHHCHCIDECENIPNVLVMQLDETKANELKNHSSVKDIHPELTPFSPDIPTPFSKTRTFTGSSPSVSLDPKLYGPLQFYYFNNQINSNGLLIGTHRWTGTPPPLNDDSTSVAGTYTSYWTGKNIDIVTLEVNGTKNNAVLSGNPHPDFVKIGTQSTIKVIPTNWTGAGLSNADNTNQASTTTILTSHAIGVLSAASGTYCGFAKKSNLYVTYYENAVSNINSVISWHNSKAVNPETGVKNPTILIHEYQFLASNQYLYKIQDVTEFTYVNTSTGISETITRPVGGWGTDLTPFRSRNFNIKRVLENGAYHWCIAITGVTATALLAAINSASAAGIINVVAAGNDCGVYVKENDVNYNSTFTVQSTATYFTLTPTISGAGIVAQAGPLGVDTTEYSFRPYGPAGARTAIDVAAGQNSERHPILDHYSNRGPGIDIIGMGSNTWTSRPTSLYSDGNFWGMFSGTSCAAPTVVGILACLLEKHYYYNGVWPTPTQAKEILLSEAKKDVLELTTATTWANVPNASAQIKGREIAASPYDLMLIYDNVVVNGGISNNESLGTPNVRAFIDNSINKINNSNGSRPVQGHVYPRRKIKIG